MYNRGYFFCNSTHVETVVILSLKTDTPKLEIQIELPNESFYTPEERDKRVYQS